MLRLRICAKDTTIAGMNEWMNGEHLKGSKHLSIIWLMFAAQCSKMRVFLEFWFKWKESTDSY